VPLSAKGKWKLDRWRETLTGMFGSRQSQRKPQLCPACGKLVGATAKKCHECGASLTFSLAAASRSLSKLIPTESPVTYVILTLNMLVFAVCLMATLRMGGGISFFGGIDGGILLRLGARQSILILSEGEVWRLVTAMFLHGSLIHILFNTWVLMDVAPQVEEVYGSPRFLFLYVATGIASFIVSVAWNVVTRGGFGIGVGASGALLGLIGLMLAITQRRGGSHMQALRGQLIRWLIYIAVLGLLMPMIDNAAHAGGLAAGYLLGRVIADREPHGAAERKRAQWMGWGAALVVLLSFAAMMLGYFRAPAV
jgi:rhomboid protease GluP